MYLLLPIRCMIYIKNDNFDKIIFLIYNKLMFIKYTASKIFLLGEILI